MESKPTIVFFFNDWVVEPQGANCGGGEIATLSAAEAFSKLGYRTIACGNLPNGDETVRGVEYWNFGGDYQLQPIAERLKDIGPYYAFAATLVHPLLFLQDAPNCLSKIVINHSPGVVPSGLEPRTVMHLVDRFVCVSEAQKNLVLSRGDVPAEKMRVIKNGFNPELFQYAGPENREWDKMMFVGRLEPAKGIHFLIETFSELRQQFPTLKLNVFGNKDAWPELSAQCARLQAECPDLAFHGKVPQTRIAEEMRTSGILVFPSASFESAGLAVLDAQASGCPVVASAIGGVPEYLIEGDCGLLVPYNDHFTMNLKETLALLLRDTPRLQQMSRNCEKLARENTWEAVATALLKEANEISATTTTSPSVSTTKQTSSPTKISVIQDYRDEIAVSAIVSTYDAASYMEGCLTDLTEQSLFKKGQMEIVIIDCASPGDEASIIKRFQDQHNNITSVRITERETLYGAWNLGIKFASGKYVTNANTDDRHHPEGIEKMYKAIDANPHIDLVYGDVFQSTTPNESYNENSQTTLLRYKEYFAPEVLLHYQFGCQPLWRVSLHEKIGLFDSTMRAAGDYEFNLRFALAGLKAKHIQEPLGLFLERTDSISQADSTSVNEQGELRKKYITPQNILKLYEAEGWSVNTPEEQVAALHDLSLRSLGFELPWHPGNTFRDAEVGFTSLSGALDIRQGNPTLLNNFAVVLQSVGQLDDAKNLFQQISDVKDDPVITRNKERSLQTDLTDVNFEICSELRL